jgi:L-cysteine S-thiosulfotransferase
MRAAAFAVAALMVAIALLTTSASAQSTSAASPIQQGFALMFDQRSGNCTACHSIPDSQGKKTGTQSTFAPPLDGVGSRYNKATLTQWVTDARVIRPSTLMPPFGVDWATTTAQGRLLTDAQIADVVAALQTLR